MKNDKAPEANSEAGLCLLCIHILLLKYLTFNKSSKDDEAVNLWKDRICPLVDDFVDTAAQLGKEISKMFRNDHDMSTGELLGYLGGNLMINVL